MPRRISLMFISAVCLSFSFSSVPINKITHIYSCSQCLAHLCGLFIYLFVKKKKKMLIMLQLNPKPIFFKQVFLCSADFYTTAKWNLFSHFFLFFFFLPCWIFYRSLHWADHPQTQPRSRRFERQ